MKFIATRIARPKLLGGATALRERVVFLLFSLLVALFATLSTSAIAATTYREYDKTYPTYPYDDPNPVPEFTQFYPYFRFDGFADQPVEQAWHVVELSNDYLTLTILPQIGGKIWTVTEKSTGKSIVYSNPVIKFRDIAMRGPWTSGGIEMNVGIIGHTPNCSSPVDYAVRQNDDGSVSCFIGAMDLITRSRWTVEICLPDFAAIFSTRMFWQNSSGLNQPYYTWTNVGMRASDDLQYVNFGTHFVGHDGELSEWPIDPKSGKDLSWYINNDFGSYKSYHIVGQLRDFFGAYYHGDDFGTACVIPYEGKRGRKIWMWGASREGMIWEDLLTDPPGGQYIEIQSGRLFNQTSTASGQTPFKHREFAPYTSDTWTEYWMPVLHTNGYNVAGRAGAMRVSVQEMDGKKRIVVRISPTQFQNAALKIYEGDQLLSEENLDLRPTEMQERVLDMETLEDAKLRVTLGDTTRSDSSLVFDADETKTLVDRPWAPVDAPLQTTGPTASYLAGRERMREREYRDADAAYRKCLEEDPLYLPAWVGLAENAYRRGEYAQAVEYCRRALSIDLYDAAANYQSGLAHAALNDWTNAEEAFCVAALSDQNRSAVFTELTAVNLHEQKYQRAMDMVEKALDANRLNLDALWMKLCLLRVSDANSAEQREAFLTLSQQLLRENPLNHAVRVERFLAGAETASSVLDAVRWELPHETFLELAARYTRIGRREDAIAVLQIALGKKGILRTELLYWLAYLTENLDLLKRAEAEPIDFCFPFRPESLPVFQWAYDQDHGEDSANAWKNLYYLAILEKYCGKDERAITLLQECGNRPDIATFYLFRGETLSKNPSGDASANSLDDFRHAFQLAPDQARAAVAYVTALEKAGKSDEAFKLTETDVQRFPLNPKLVLMYARALIQQEREEEAWKFLKSAVFLPNEGSVYGRIIFHEAAIWTAAKKYRDAQWQEAFEMAQEAKQWPENLGSGKPFPEYCDERLEDWLIYCSAMQLGKTDEATKAIERILEPVNEAQRTKFEAAPLHPLWTALATRAAGGAASARAGLERWNETATDAAKPLSSWAIQYFDGKSLQMPKEMEVNRSLELKVLEMIRK